MDWMLLPTQLFLEQVDQLSLDAKRILDKRLALVKINPARNKRIVGFGLVLFRIRFEDSRSEKRAIYLVDKPFVKLLCILDRAHGYKDLKGYLDKIGESRS